MGYDTMYSNTELCNDFFFLNKLLLILFVEFLVNVAQFSLSFYFKVTMLEIDSKIISHPPLYAIAPYHPFIMSIFSTIERGWLKSAFALLCKMLHGLHQVHGQQPSSVASVSVRRGKVRESSRFYLFILIFSCFS